MYLNDKPVTSPREARLLSSLLCSMGIPSSIPCSLFQISGLLSFHSACFIFSFSRSISRGCACHLRELNLPQPGPPLWVASLSARGFLSAFRDGPPGIARRAADHVLVDEAGDAAWRQLPPGSGASRARGGPEVADSRCGGS
jgi:hypothetical protein